jgi:hypothetical protein
MGTSHKYARALLAGAATLIAGYAASAAISPLVFGQQGGPAVDNAGPVGARQVVASGTDAVFGRWELLISQNKTGGICRGVRLLDLAPGPSIFEGCGGDYVEKNLATVTLPEGQKGTLFFGRVDDGIAQARIAVNGKTLKSVTPARDNTGASYIVTSVPETVPSAAVTATDASGRVLKRLDPTAEAAR